MKKRKISVMQLRWNQHFDGRSWFLEDGQKHTAGEVTWNAGRYEAGVAMPLHINEKGEEQDWLPADSDFGSLEEAKAWAEEKCTCTVQGEILRKEDGKIFVNY